MSGSTRDPWIEIKKAIKKAGRLLSGSTRDPWIEMQTARGDDNGL